MELIDREQLTQFLSILFKDLFPADDGEAVEIIHDKNNNLNYSRAYNRFLGDSFDSFVEATTAAIEGLSLEGDNCAIIPMTVFKTQSTLNKRSSEKEARRGCVWILEIEPQKQDKLSYIKKGILPFNNSPESQELLEKLVVPVLEELPEEIRNAVHSIYTTGGGVNLIVKFSRPVTADESKRLSALFSRIIKDMKEKNPELCIDESSAKIFHGQRIVGTRNYKYNGYLVKFEDRERFISAPFEPLNIENLLMENEFQLRGNPEELKERLEELERITFGFVTKPQQRYEIEEILRQADIPTLFPEVKVKNDSLNYYACHCPFHPPDRNPSFIIYKNRDKDGIQIAVDYHDGQIYNAIKLAQELYGYDFKEAIKWLAEALDITPEKVEQVVKKRKQEEKQKIEQTLSSKDFVQLITEWLELVGIDINTTQLFIDRDNPNNSYLVVKAKDFLGNDREILFRLSDFRNFKVFGQKLVAVLGSSSVFPQVNKKQEQDFLNELFFLLVENAYLKGQYQEFGLTREDILSVISIEISERGNALLTLPEVVFLGRGIAKKDNEYYIAASTLYEIMAKNRFLNLRDFKEIDTIFKRLDFKEPQKIGMHRFFVFDESELQIVTPEKRKELISRALEGEEIIDMLTGESEKTKQVENNSEAVLEPNESQPVEQVQSDEIEEPSVEKNIEDDLNLDESDAAVEPTNALEEIDLDSLDDDGISEIIDF